MQAILKAFICIFRLKCRMRINSPKLKFTAHNTLTPKKFKLKWCLSVCLLCLSVFLGPVQTFLWGDPDSSVSLTRGSTRIGLWPTCWHLECRLHGERRTIDSDVYTVKCWKQDSFYGWTIVIWGLKKIKTMKFNLSL